MKTFALAAAALFSLASIGGASAQTIIDTDFESGADGFTLAGNVGITNGAAYVTFAGGVGSAGAQANDFTTFGAGAQGGIGLVSQSFTTVLGKVYTLSFDYGAFNSTAQTLEYDVAGLTSGSLTSPSGTNNLDLLFQPFTTTFVGNGGTTVLTFSSNSVSDGADILLDNISLTGVPEASTWALLILGFGAVGVSARRGRARVASGLRTA